MATKKKAKETATEKYTIENVVDRVKDMSKDINDFALETTEDILDGALNRTEQWQGIASKAIDGGLKLAANQQEIVFDALESIKGQLSHSRKRFSSLFSKN